MSDLNERFVCRVYLGKDKVEARNHRINLNENAPGRCLLTVKGYPERHTLVAVELGWGQAISRVFLGYVDRVQPAENGWSVLFCREIVGTLFHSLSVILRHPTLPQLLEQLSSHTGLQFVTPDKAYSRTTIPCFYADGNGCWVMDELGKAFGISDFFWQQQGNGQVYVGDWKDSYWADKPLDIPQKLMHTNEAGLSMTVAALPKLRPGALVNGNRVRSLDFEGTEVKITWNQ